MITEIFRLIVFPYVKTGSPKKPAWQGRGDATKTMTATVNQHPEDVKAAIRKTGVTLVALGARMGVPGCTIRKSLYVPCPKGNRVIAAYLGRRLHELWPEWYDETGIRISARSAGKHSSARPGGHGQKGAGA